MTRQRPFVLLLLAIMAALLGVLRTTLEGRPDFLSRFLLLVGGVLVLLFLIRVAGEIRFLTLHLQSFSEPGLTVTLLLVGLLLVLGAAAVNRSTVRLDLTRQRAYTLSPGAREVVAGIDRDVEMVGFLRYDTPAWRDARELLDMFDAESRRIRTRLVDPEMDPIAARAYGIEERGLFLLLSEEREERVTDLSERALTAGVIRLVTGKGREVLFSKGHGEISLRESRPSGLSKLFRYLAEDGYRVGRINLAYADSFPEPPGMVVLAGPRTALLPGEIGNLLDFLDRGGRVAAFLEPDIETGLETVLPSRGIRLLDGALVDLGPTGQGLGLEPAELLVEPTRDHPSVAHLRSRGLLHGARALEETMSRREVSESAVLLRAGMEAMLPGEEEGQRRQGAAVAVAAAWQVPVGDATMAELQERPWGRLVVVGDSDVLTNGYLDRQGNRQIALSLIHWLAQEDLLLRAEGVRPPELFVMSEGPYNTLRLVIVLVLPLVTLLAGLFVWLRSRATEGA